MKDEIKEIINYFKDDIEFLEKELKNPNFLGRYITIRDKECDYLKRLLDYITNLQNENMKYDQCLTELTDNYKDLQKELTNLQEENERLSRTTVMYDELLGSKNNIIAKAIEYIEKNPVNACHYLLNILQGEDNE